MPAGEGLARASPYLLLAIFFVVSYSLRPLLPVDETRYLTVAWEMYLRGSVFVPTLNFEPYFQRPPLLFWLIDVVWSVVGVSRAAAMAAIFGISSAAIYLSGRLARALFPDNAGMAQRVPWIMLGNAVFMIYSTLILFDILQMLFVILNLMALIALGRHGRLWFAVLAGLAIGFGVLAKGPVLLLHVAFPIAFYPLWRDRMSNIAPKRFYAALLIALIAGGAVVGAWLGPAIYETGRNFAYDLVRKQATEQISSALEAMRARPIYFYLALLPIALLPWLLSVDFWQRRLWKAVWPGAGIPETDRRRLWFLVVWGAGIVAVFSLIPAKQPHYIVPALPAIVLLLGYCMAALPLFVFRNAGVIMVLVFSMAQVVGHFEIFPRFDLTALSSFVAEHRQAEWAFADEYQGELTFLARLEKPFEIIPDASVDRWIADHPDGYVVRATNHYPDPNYRLYVVQLVDRGYLSILGSSKTAAP